jgi:virulence-associated protein VapD
MSESNTPYKTLIAIFILFTFITCNGILPFVEKNGLLTIEMESGIINDPRWKIGTETETINGQSVETKYIHWTGSQSFNALSSAPITYKIKINTPGTYRFAWRMRIGLGTSTGEHNDAWLKIDGEDFYGIREGTKVYPRPFCTNNNLSCAAGTSTQDFIKAYGNRLTWGFVTNTNDHVAHQVFVTFDKAKEYTITVDARSSFLFIDKLVLRRNGISDATAFNLANTESTCFDIALSSNDFDTNQTSVYPNPTYHNISITNLDINSTIYVINSVGEVVKKVKVYEITQTIDFTDLHTGLYLLAIENQRQKQYKKIIKL